MAEVGHVTVHAPAAHLSLGIALAELADRVWDWPGLGPRDPLPFRLIIVPDRDGFGRVSRGRIPSWGVGLAEPATRTIVLRADAPDLRRALRHELAHLALREAVRARLPLWFDEGYAVVAAGELDRLAALQLNLAVVRGAVKDLRTVDAGLRRASGEAETSYALAGSAVLLLARLNPTGSLGPLMERLQAGDDFDAAVLATTGYTTDRFDGVWQRDLRRRHGWLVWLGAGGLWTLAGGAVVALVILRRRRDRPRRAALDEGWVIPADADAGGESDARA
jgi:hypothetical protein